MKIAFSKDTGKPSVVSFVDHQFDSDTTVVFEVSEERLSDIFDGVDDSDVYGHFDKEEAVNDPLKYYPCLILEDGEIVYDDQHEWGVE